MNVVSKSLPFVAAETIDMVHEKLVELARN